MKVGDVVICMYNGDIGVVIEDKSDSCLYRVHFMSGEVDFWRSGSMLEVI